MENLIKRNNFSPEDKKILFKIDKHIKQLEKKIEQGGSGGGESVNSHDLNLTIDNIPLANSLTDVLDFINHYDDYEINDDEFTIIEPLNLDYKFGDIVNVYINNKFYKKCHYLNEDSNGMKLTAIVQKDFYPLLIDDGEKEPNKLKENDSMSFSELTSSIVYIFMSDANMSALILPQYINVNVKYSLSQQELKRNKNTFDILSNHLLNVTFLSSTYRYTKNYQTSTEMSRNVVCKVLRQEKDGIIFKVPVKDTEYYLYKLLPDGNLEDMEHHVYDNETLYNRIQSIDDSIVQSLNTPI